MNNQANLLPETLSLDRAMNATQLLHLIDQCDNTINLISLDCFDTLLWRKTSSPIDVFYDLQHKPIFKELNFTAELRVRAEAKARQKMFYKRGHGEVTLDDIYRSNFPDATNEQLNALIEEELTAENDVCYAFPSMIELIRKANAKGLGVIIVSDTYLQRSQLHELLENKLPLDVMDCIRDIFCSSEWKASKVNGLFTHVLNQLNVDEQSILHIGDHPLADVKSAKEHGLQAIQFIHHNDEMAELLRMHTLAASFMDPTIRSTRGLINPFKGVLASNLASNLQPENLIGYASLGPLMYCFSQFLLDEIEVLKQKSKKLKILFLMRDAYLPYLACEVLMDEKVGHRVSISRFVAYAASFRNKIDVDDYLMGIATVFRFDDVCRQLLLPDDIATSLIETAESSTHPRKMFIKLIQQPSILDIIFKQSKSYFQRLIKYLENEVDLQPGDTLVFIDLGYSGTAQKQLEQVFRNEMGIEIIGRYLIALPTPNWQTSKRGLLDSFSCDYKSMNMLVSYIALLEQLCTSSDNSVIDYSDDGQPIYSDTSILKKQYEKLKTIQDECIRFVSEAKQFFIKASINLAYAVLRDIVKSELCRLLFFQSSKELSYLKTFNFDLNLGTDEILPLFDLHKGLSGLRRRGLLFMETNFKTMRTNYPIELRSAGLELSFTLMLTHKLGLNLRTNELSLRRQNINIIAFRDSEEVRATLQALPTYDGYFAVIVPICEGNYHAQILFGEHYKWIQVECAEYVYADALHGNKESDHTYDAWSDITLNNIHQRDKGLFECTSLQGSFMITPTSDITENNFILRIVFRPLVLAN